MHIQLNAQDVVLGLTPGNSPTTVCLTITAGTNLVVIEGTPQQLRQRVLDGFSLPVPADVPLFDAEEV